jgi:prolyl-tRNA synthetase
LTRTLVSSTVDLILCSQAHSIAVSPLALDENTFARVTTVLDSSIATSSSLFALRNKSATETIFLTSSDLVKYLKHLEKADVKLHEIDFDALKTEAAAAPAAPAPKAAKAKAEKEDAKIEGAVQIAVGVKKEVDFSTWYTNV